MKTKNRILSLFFAVFFCSVFFIGIKQVNAQTYSECRDLYGGTASDCAGYPGDPSLNESNDEYVDNWSAWDNTDSSNYNENVSNSMPVQCADDEILDFMTNSCVPAQTQVQYTYSECKADGGDEAYCGGFPGAPTTAQDMNQNSAGYCNFNSDCGSGFKCYQQSCMDDETYQENVSWWDRTGNATSQAFSSGGSVFSGNGTPSTSTFGTTKQTTTINGTNIPAGSRIMTDGSVRDSNYNVILPPNSLPIPSENSSDSSFVMCANGVINPECRDENGNAVAGTAISLVPVGSGGGLPGSDDFVGPPTAAMVGCGEGFEPVAGVCFPVNTGLSDAPVYLILSNLFSWLMGLFTTFAVLAFVLSGIQYFMSSGDESMAETAKENAKNAIVGIIVGLSGFVIIKAIVAALSGQSYFF